MRVLVIMAKDLSQAMRDWKTALFLLFMPLAFTVFFGLAALGSPEDARLRIGWEDRDPGGTAGPALRSLLESLPNVEVIETGAMGRESAEAAVRRGKLAAAVEVPQGFSSAALEPAAPAGAEGYEPSPALALAVVADSGTAAGRAAVEAIRAGAGRVRGSARAAQLSLAAVSELAPPAVVPGETARKTWLGEAFADALRSWGRPRVNVEIQRAGKLAYASGFTQASPGMIVQFAIFGLISSAMIIVLERRSGAMRRLLTTSAGPASIIGGHLAAMFLIVLLQECILVACGQLFFGVRYLAAPLATALMIVALAAWAAALGLFIGALARKEQQVIAFSLAAMFIFAALGGAWFPLDVAGSGFARIGRLLPSAWAMTGLQNIVLRGEGVSSVLVPAGILIAWAAAFFAVALWRFRFEG